MEAARQVSVLSSPLAGWLALDPASQVGIRSLRWALYAQGITHGPSASGIRSCTPVGSGAVGSLRAKLAKPYDAATAALV